MVQKKQNKRKAYTKTIKRNSSLAKKRKGMSTRRVKVRGRR